MEVYSLVSSAKHYSPGFAHLPQGRLQDLLIHKPSQLAGEHTALLPSRLWKRKEAFTVLPDTHLLLGRESVRVGKGLA